MKNTISHKCPRPDANSEKRQLNFCILIAQISTEFTWCNRVLSKLLLKFTESELQTRRMNASHIIALHSMSPDARTPTGQSNAKAPMILIMIYDREIPACMWVIYEFRRIIRHSATDRPAANNGQQREQQWQHKQKNKINFWQTDDKLCCVGNQLLSPGRARAYIMYAFIWGT